MKPRGAALKAMRPAPGAATSNFYLALYGAPVAVPNGPGMAELATLCAHHREISAGEPGAVQERWLARWLAPRLAKLLGESLADLNAQTFRDFAAIIDAVRLQRESKQSELPFHSKALLRAHLLRVERGISRGDPLPVTMNKFLKLLGEPERDHDSEGYFRREFKRLGLRFRPDTKGRPKKG